MSNTVYPGAIDSPYNPTTSDTLATANHHLIEGLQNDAVVQLETKLGTGSSNQTPNTGMYLVGTGSGATQWVSTLTSPSITTSLKDSNSNTWIGENAAASAVNYPNIGNSATGNAVTYGAAGSDSNIDTNITSKGGGKVRDNGSAFVDFRSSFANFVQSGCIWTAGSGLTASMTAGTVWINGIEYSIGSVSSNSFTASKDTYVDYTVGTGLVYNVVSNNAASPALAANSIRLAIIVTGASTVSYVNQGQVAAVLPIASSVNYSVADSLGNLIFPTYGSPPTLGYRQITSTFSTSSTSATQVTGLSAPIIPPAFVRRIRAVFSCRDAFRTGGGIFDISMWSGTVGSGTQFMDAEPNQAAGAAAVTVTGYLDVTPGTTYTINMGFSSSATASASIEAGSTYPANLKVEPA